MNIAKPILGLLLITLCSTAWGKTLEEYAKEARSKSTICQKYEETKLSNSKALTTLRPPTVQETVSAGIMGEDLNKSYSNKSKDYYADFEARQDAEQKLSVECGKDMQQYFAPEALPLREARRKAFIAERVAAGTMNPDGTFRKPPFYDDWFSWKRTKNYFMELLESIGQLLLWPIAIITLLAGLMLITQPREFARMMLMVIQGIVNLLFKKN